MSRASPSPCENAGESAVSGRRCAAAIAAGWLLLGILVWRFHFLADDAFIALRYAANWAGGAGLSYNPGDEAPVEGFSCPLWVLGLGLLARAGFDPAFWAPVLSCSCGAWLVARVTVFLDRRLELGAGGRMATAVFLATLPPLAIWSTGGLAAVPTTLVLFAAWERLAGDPERLRPVQAGLALAVAAWLRVDGPIFGAGILLLAALDLRWRRRSCRLLLWPAVLLAGAVLALSLWRWSLFGEIVPHVAKLKGGLSAMRSERGLLYVAAFGFALPAVPIAWALAVAAGRHRQLVLQASLAVLGTMAFAVVVGGDFMPFWRLFVIAAPAIAALFGVAWIRLRALSPAVAVAWGLLAIGSHLAVAFDTHVSPRPWREAVGFRWGEGYRTEFAEWRDAVDKVERWSRLGRELRRRTQPGDSLLGRGIGAIGYYSDLVIFDVFGVVTRWPGDKRPELRRALAGHDAVIPFEALLERRPRYALPHFARADADLDSGLPPGWRASALGELTEVLRFPAAPRAGDPADMELRVVQFLRWDWLGTSVMPLVEAVRDLDPRDAVAAERGLVRRFDPRGSAARGLNDELLALLSEGRLARYGADEVRFSQVARSSSLTAGFSVESVRLSGAGPTVELPRGAFAYAVAASGVPLLDGRPPGWSVVAAGHHTPRVNGGTMLILFLVPGGELRWSRPK